MPRVTVTVDEDQRELIKEKSREDGEYESQSAFVRQCIQEYEDAERLRQRVADLEAEIDSLREQRDQLQEEAERVAELQRQVERLRNEKQTLVEEREEKQALVRYVEDERRVEQQWRETPLWTRLKWRVFGMPSKT